MTNGRGIRFVSICATALWIGTSKAQELGTFAFYVKSPTPSIQGHDPMAFRTVQPDNTWSGEERHYNPGELPEVVVRTWISEFGPNGDMSQAYWKYGETNYGNVVVLSSEGNPMAVSLFEDPIFIVLSLGATGGFHAMATITRNASGSVRNATIRTFFRTNGGVDDLLKGTLDDMTALVQKEFAEELAEGSRLALVGSYARGQARIPRAFFQRLPKPLRERIASRASDVDAVILMPDRTTPMKLVDTWGEAQNSGKLLEAALRSRNPRQFIPDIDIHASRFKEVLEIVQEEGIIQAFKPYSLVRDPILRTSVREGFDYVFLTEPAERLAVAVGIP